MVHRTSSSYPAERAKATHSATSRSPSPGRGPTARPAEVAAWRRARRPHAEDRSGPLARPARAIQPALPGSSRRAANSARTPDDELLEARPPPVLAGEEDAVALEHPADVAGTERADRYRPGRRSPPSTPVIVRIALTRSACRSSSIGSSRLDTCRAERSSSVARARAPWVGQPEQLHPAVIGGSGACRAGRAAPGG